MVKAMKLVINIFFQRTLRNLSVIVSTFFLYCLLPLAYKSSQGNDIPAVKAFVIKQEFQGVFN